MSEMKQRVAAAILSMSGPTQFDPLMPRMMTHQSEAFAYAAIAALREPTDALLEAGCAAHPKGDYHSGTTLEDIIRAEWEAMIDQALK